MVESEVDTFVLLELFDTLTAVATPVEVVVADEVGTLALALALALTLALALAAVLVSVEAILGILVQSCFMNGEIFDFKSVFAQKL